MHRLLYRLYPSLNRSKVAPFDGKLAKAQIEQAMGGLPVEAWFDEFDIQPLASASVAQVHTARLKSNGKEVVIKRVGDGVLLMPIENPWHMIEAALNAFEPAFKIERQQPEHQIRPEVLP